MSDRLLTYRVQLAGQAEFVRDFASMQAAMKQHAKQDVFLAKAVSDQKRAIKSGEQKHNEAMLRVQLAIEKARAKESEREYQRHQQSLAKTQQSFEKARTREAERAEKEKTTVAAREAKARAQNVANFHRETLRQHQADLRAFERHERDKTRIADREARQRQRDERTRERDRMFDHKRLYRGIATGIGQGAYGALTTVAGIGGGVVRSIGRGAGVGDAFSISDIVQQELKVGSLMRSVAIEARTAGGQFSFDEAGARSKIRGSALKYGLSQRDLAEAIDVYSEKGSGATAVANIDRIASQATAMGTSAATVAKLRAQLGLSSSMSGKEMSEDAKDKAIAMMHFMGKTGVFRAESMAEESEQLFSSFAKGGGNFEKGLTRYYAFANEARKSTGSGATARTAINSVQDQIAKKESKINALGIKTRDKDGGQRDFIEVVMDVITKTGGKGKAYTNIFDPARSGKALSSLETAARTAGGGKAGHAAMEKLLAGDASLKDATVAEMQKDAAARLNDPAVRFAQASEKVRQALADKLLPVLEKLSARAPEIAAAIAKAVEWITDNPKKALGAVVAAGAFKGAAPAVGGAALRFAGDTIANVVPGFGGKTVGGALANAGSTPVFVTGAAPGVMGGGAGGAGDLAKAATQLGKSTLGMAVILAAIVAKMSLDPDDQGGEKEQRKMKEAQSDQARYMELRDQGYSEKDALKAMKEGTTSEKAALEAINSPYAEPVDYLRDKLDPAMVNSPLASVEDAIWRKGNTTFDFSANPNVNSLTDKQMVNKPGDAGYGVVAPKETPKATQDIMDATDAAKELARATRDATRMMQGFANGVSAFKGLPSK